MAAHNETKSYMTFKLGKETFASDVENVLSILEVPKITVVPQTPEYMLGVMNLRGEVLPVIDTRIKFGMPPASITQNTCVLVLELKMANGTIKIGAMVDNVVAVIEIKNEEIKPSPTIGTKYNTDFIVGLVQKSDDFIMLLDMQKVFSTVNIEELNVA